MQANQPLSWKPAPASVDRLSGVQPSAKPDAAASPAFRAVLERLETAARELSRRSESIEDAKDLSGAVQDAASSLSDALALRDSVLDAYRSAQQASKGKEEDAA